MTHALLEDTFYDDLKWEAIAADLEVDPLMVCGFVARLWSWAVKHAVDGVLSDTPHPLIAKKLGWTGDPARLFRALTVHGVIDETELGPELHGWMERFPKFDKAQRKRAQRIARKGDQMKLRLDRAVVSSTEWSSRETTERSSPRSDLRGERERSENDLRETAPAREMIVLDEPITETIIEDETVIDLDLGRTAGGIACDEPTFLDLWAKLCAGQGRIKPQLVLTGIERACLFRAPRPEQFWRQLLSSVGDSAFLRGEKTGFVASIRWVLEHTEEIRSGRYAGAPPALSNRKTSGLSSRGEDLMLGVLEAAARERVQA